MNKPSSSELEAIKTRCFEVIDRFHHREALSDDVIRSWVSTVAQEQGDAAVWHATRAGGFGGSDIGVLVRNFGGHRADHMNSAHDIVAAKLLKTTPMKDTGDLRRGHENEEPHAKKFYAKYGAQRDFGAFDRLASSSGLRKWMRYSPDDVVLVPSSQPNPALGGAYARRLLIDYKAPRRVDEDDSIAFQYACQLHQGAMVCAKSKIHLDGLMLSQFDWANWCLKDDDVPYDPEMSKLILQAGDHYFDCVMRGELPPYVMTPRLENDAHFIEAYGFKAQRLAHLSATRKAFEDEEALLSAELKASLKDVRLAGKKLKMGDLTVTAVNMVDHAKVNELLGPEGVLNLRKKNAEPDFDASAMAEKLNAMGVNTDKYRIDKIDAEKAYPELLEKGFDPEQFMKEQIRFSASNFLKDAAKQLVLSSFPREEQAQEDEDQIDEHGESSLNQQSESENVREGQITERHSQRTAMV
jgi:hypothetical protein